ncbi:MAG: hypothetical protein LBM27_04035 [Lactobacillaceae bacterium]|jgi:hypothetical protein|nr:hypothetical protein [Lactobacillaceae bacterium]
MEQNILKLQRQNKLVMLLEVISLVLLYTALIFGIIVYSQTQNITLLEKQPVFTILAISWWVLSIPIFVESIRALNIEKELKSIAGLTLPIYTSIIGAVVTFTIVLSVLLLTLPTTVLYITSIMSLHRQNKILNQKVQELNQSEVTDESENNVK